MATNHTTNYQLNQWEATDQVLRTDFNQDNQKIDGALKSQADAIAAVSSAMTGKGNCSIEYQTYTGNGVYGSGNRTSITFSAVPTLVIIAGGRAVTFIMDETGSNLMIIGGGGSSVNIIGMSASWSGNTLSYYNSDAKTQMNTSGTTYRVYAFYAKDA